MSITFKKVAISLAATIGLALPVSAFAGDEKTADKSKQEIPPPTMDTDGDGKPDAWDRDANGVPDAWDTDGDGKPDALDNDGDGKPDNPAPAPKPES